MSDNRKYYYLKLKENYLQATAWGRWECTQHGILDSNIR